MDALGHRGIAFPMARRSRSKEEKPMNFKIRSVALGLAAASMLAVAMPAPANATHQLGHFALGVGAGLLIGGALANSRQGGYTYVAPPVYQPQPVYVQPTCYQKKVVVWDPYIGANVWKYQTFCN
jgi:hypothetical protein